MILLDWTRMGKTFCVAGLVPDGSGWCTVRPMPFLSHNARRFADGRGDSTARAVQATAPGPVPRNIGWFAHQLGGLRRWDVVELVGARPAEIERPHTEDLWVGALKSLDSSVSTKQRGAILRHTMVQGYKPHFGVPLFNTHSSAYLKPGIGERSLVTVVVAAYELFFEASKREGADGVDVRVRLKVPGVGVKELPVKDHFLLEEAEQCSGGEPVLLAKNLRQLVAKMGDTIAVRRGLSRGYGTGPGELRCWLMAAGFFPMEKIADTCR